MRTKEGRIICPRIFVRAKKRKKAPKMGAFFEKKNLADKTDDPNRTTAATTHGGYTEDDYRLIDAIRALPPHVQDSIHTIVSNSTPAPKGAGKRVE